MFQVGDHEIQLARACFVATLLTALGCTSAAEPSERSAEALMPNSRSAQSPKLNGNRLNGLALQASVAEPGDAVQSALAVNGQALEGLYVEGSQLGAFVAGTSEVVSGEALVGATLEISFAESGVAVPYLLRIDDVTLDTGAATSDVYLYSMSYRRQRDAVWRPLCADADGAPEPVLPIQGHRWDAITGQHSDEPGFITLACEGGAIGRCATWGYRPWVPALLAHHQACIYMKRADYCGDGRSYTADGTIIDLYDHLAPPIQAPATTWPLEAHWGTQGASCVSARRHPEIPFSGRCLRDGQLVTLPACGAAAGPGDLLSDRVHPRE